MEVESTEQAQEQANGEQQESFMDRVKRFAQEDWLALSRGYVPSEVALANANVCEEIDGEEIESEADALQYYMGGPGLRTRTADPPAGDYESTARVGGPFFHHPPSAPTKGNEASSNEDDQPATAKPPAKTIFEHAHEVAERAKAGDADANDELARILDANPDLWQSLGDLGWHAEKLLTLRIAGGYALKEECVRRHAESLRKSLLPKDPTALEKLAMQRVVQCWLFAQYVDSVVLNIDGTPPGVWAKYQEVAEKRFQLALKSLTYATRLAGRANSRSLPDTLAATLDAEDSSQQHDPAVKVRAAG